MEKYIYKHKLLFVTTVSVHMLCGFCTILLSFAVKRIGDAGAEKDWNIFIQAAGLCLLGVAFYWVMMCLQSKITALYTKKTVISLKDDIISKVINSGIRKMEEGNTTKFISVLLNDITILENNYILNIVTIFGFVFRSIICGISVLYLQPIVAVIVIPVSFIPILAPALMGGILSKIQGEYSKSMEQYTSKIKDMLSGFEVMKSFGIETKVSSNLKKETEMIEEKKRSTTQTAGYLESTSDSLFWFVGLVRELTSVSMVIMGKMSFGDMMAIDNLAGNVAGPIRRTAALLGEMKGTKEIRDKIMAILNEPEPANGQLSLPENLDGKIEVRDVTFSYDGSKNILDHVSYTFEKGKKYALVGNSGCGKSTLLKLMMQYYDTYTGSIYYDGTELKEAEKSSLYQTMSMIHQNIFLYNDTIENNITLYNDYPQQEIQRAIQESGLEKVVSALPEGVQTIVNENGNNFSGGEKQRIAIARVFLRKTPVLLLDEATSSLDNETAYAIESLLLSKKDITGIVITHKLNENILKQYDQIIALDKGKICECGTFDELIQKQGYFYNLYHVFDSAEIMEGPSVTLKAGAGTEQLPLL